MSLTQHLRQHDAPGESYDVFEYARNMFASARRFKVRQLFEREKRSRELQPCVDRALAALAAMKHKPVETAAGDTGERILSILRQNKKPMLMSHIQTKLGCRRSTAANAILELGDKIKRKRDGMKLWYSLPLLLAVCYLLSPNSCPAQPYPRLFAPALTAIVPPVAATNRTFNLGLVWDAVPVPGQTYRVRYGTNTGAAHFTNTVSAGTNTSVTISNLPYRVVWYFQAFSVIGTNVSEGSNLLQVQPPLTNYVTVSAVFPLYTATNVTGPWVTNTVALATVTNPPGALYFKTHFRQLEYLWTNNQIKLRANP